MATILKRLSVLPFETLMAGLAIISGIVGFFALGTTTDALNALLPEWLVHAFYVLYFIAGMGMLVGLALGRASIEGAGLVLLGVGVVVRFFSLVAFQAPFGQLVTPLFFYLLVTWACYARLRTLFEREVVVKLKQGQIEGDVGAK
jgi:hypothetical protein